MKKSMLFTINILLITLSGYAQAGEKGTAVINNATKTEVGKTWAVIVGISEYKDIAKLNYAHKDAEAFYNYLRTPQLNIPAANMKLLLNRDASSAEIYGALDWLAESVKENDKVIFYFSGHGDVEKKTIHQNGFLLAYDAPTAAYMTKGTISIKFLQDYLETYVGINKAKEALLIVDACKSGKLAGGMEGIKTTMQALGRQWNGQITKILSAQEGELSLEDPKWGGGRGVFSYYLMKGIQGLANRNVDHTITTGELAAYLPIVVGDETANSQNPKIEGDPKHPLFDFDEVLLANAKKDDGIKTEMIAANRKGFMDELKPFIAGAYTKYSDYIKKGWLLWGENEQDTINSALHYYKQLIDHPDAITIRPSLKSSFLSALQKSTQSNLDSLLKGRRMRSDYFRSTKEIAYAASIVDKNHILYNYINARALYYQSKQIKDDVKAIAMLKEALKLEEDAPYLYFGIAVIYDDAKKLDSAIHYYQKAQEFAPTWDYPSINIGTIYFNEKEDLETAKQYFLKAIQLNEQSYLGNNNLGLYYGKVKQYEKAIACFKKVIALDSADASYYHGNIIDVYLKMNQSDTAINYANNILSLHPQFINIYNKLGTMYEELGKDSAALAQYQKALFIDPSDQTTNTNLGTLYRKLNQYDKALIYHEMVTANSPKWDGGYINLGYIHEKLGNNTEAVANYKKAIRLNPYTKNGYTRLGGIYLQQNLFAEAIATFKEELKVNPKSANAFINIGNAYLNKAANDTAVYYYQKALQLDSTDSYALLNIGIAYKNLKQYQKAIYYYEKTITVDPKNSFSYASLGDLYFTINNATKAVAYYQLAIQINPKETKAYKGLAVADSTNELYYYNKILTYDSSNEYAYHFSGHAYYKKNQPFKGLAYYIKAADLSRESDCHNHIDTELARNAPFIATAIKFYEDSLLSEKNTPSAKINYMKGYLLYNQQKYLEALPYFQKAIAIDSTNTNTYNMAGITAMYLNDAKLTHAYFTRMMVLDPKNPNPNYNLACYYSLNHNIEASINNLKLSLDKGYRDDQHIMEDTDLVNLRKSPSFSLLMKKYFPEKKY